MEDRLVADRKRRGFDRFLFFTDAVTAIAVTLLILPVVDAVTQTSSKDMAVSDLLAESQGEILGFLLSFAVIIILWMAHQRVFELVGSYSPSLMLLGIVWLLSIALLPFTTALIADHADEQATVLLYVGNVAVSVYSLGVSTWVLSRQPDLLMRGAMIASDDLTVATLDILLVTITFTIALVIPGVKMGIMAVMLLAGPIHYLWRRHRRQ